MTRITHITLTILWLTIIVINSAKAVPLDIEATITVPPPASSWPVMPTDVEHVELPQGGSNPYKTDKGSLNAERLKDLSNRQCACRFKSKTPCGWGNDPISEMIQCKCKLGQLDDNWWKPYVDGDQTITSPNQNPLPYQASGKLPAWMVALLAISTIVLICIAFAVFMIYRGS